MIDTVKGFEIVNKAEIDVFRELSCFFNDPMDAGTLTSGSCGVCGNINGELQGRPSQPDAARALVPVVSPRQPTPPQETVQH